MLVMRRGVKLRGVKLRVLRRGATVVPSLLHKLIVTSFDMNYVSPL